MWFDEFRVNEENMFPKFGPNETDSSYADYIERCGASNERCVEVWPCEVDVLWIKAGETESGGGAREETEDTLDESVGYTAKRADT